MPHGFAPQQHAKTHEVAIRQGKLNLPLLLTAEYEGANHWTLLSLAARVTHGAFF